MYYGNNVLRFHKLRENVKYYKEQLIYKEVIPPLGS